MPFVIDLSGAEAQLVLKLLALWVLLTGSYIGMLAVGGPQASRYAIAAACILVQTCYSPPVSMANLTGATARRSVSAGGAELRNSRSRWLWLAWASTPNSA
jgi:hypothetical protein